MARKNSSNTRESTQELLASVRHLVETNSSPENFWGGNLKEPVWVPPTEEYPEGGYYLIEEAA